MFYICHHMSLVWYAEACQGFILEIDSVHKSGKLFWER